MSRYTVYVEVGAITTVEVEADSPKAAAELAEYHANPHLGECDQAGDWVAYAVYDEAGDDVWMRDPEDAS